MATGETTYPTYRDNRAKLPIAVVVDTLQDIECTYWMWPLLMAAIFMNGSHYFCLFIGKKGAYIYLED